MTTHHAAPLEGRLLDHNFLSTCALLDTSSLYYCCICANCNMQGFLVCGLPSGWSKEGASSTPRSWLSLSATWRSRASSGTSLACAMILAFIHQKLVYKELQEKNPEENPHPTMCFSSLELVMLIFSCIL